MYVVYQKAVEHADSPTRIRDLGHDGMTLNDFMEISNYVVESAPFVRQLMALGYDTLIIKGKNSYMGLHIPLKEIANLQKYMLNG
jgi:hypothetical protein